jgi:PAS domain S-box-containing protein
MQPFDADFRALFEQSPSALLVLAADEAFTIVAVTDAYLRAVMRQREELLGRSVFEAFPDNPQSPRAAGTRLLLASLQRVVATRAPDSPPSLRYDIPRPGGGFEERYWSTHNTPLLAADGSVRCVVHQAEDVTQLKRLLAQGDAERAELLALREAESARRELQRREAWMSAVLTSIGEAVIATDADSRVTFLNPVAASLCGLPEGAARGRRVEEVFRTVDAASRAPLGCPVARVLQEGPPATGGAHGSLLLRPDGSERAVDATTTPIRDDAGAVTGAVLVFRDVTEVRAAERALVRGASNLRRVLDANQVGTWALDLETQHIESDERLRALFGVPREAQHIEEFLARIHPDDLPGTRAAIAAAVEGRDGGRYLVEYRVLPPEGGRVRWLETRGQAYFDAAGRAERFLGTVLDVTERKMAELAREGLLEALAAQPVVFVALLRGPQLVFELANPLYQSLFHGQQLVGRPLLEALPELEGQGLDVAMHEAIATGVPFVGRELVVPLMRGDPQQLVDAIFNFVYQPVRGAHGAYDAILLVGVEVTEEVRVREDARARLAFEERLTGIVGHDLRSPLAALRMSAAQLLPGGQHAEGLTPGQVRAVERVGRAGKRIQSVITSLLDLTRARGERGFPIQPAAADLDATVRGVLEELRASHPGRAVRYVQEGDTAGRFDAERLAQVAVNLLENAFKYGEAERPVELRCEGAGDRLRLVVHNRGTPISEELQGKLFQPFSHGPQSADTVRVSLGLGLYIVREIVRAHGGDVHVESTAEEGTTFRVELPREGPPPAAPARRPAPGGQVG